ncbi:hypothetical protein [Neptuniibacter sp. CAU 1671]|uniref:hypothetical protein n=1 Tax=Neptuniibacter sp. CAU 1671 TaxID=3032593 RepID=UPI0023D990B5|nr:hypothetical protein [Neptuniibacter sp. CAU 1671]MDF2181053.1 hypothetical protein [Neptuniibacter sp. CAU 1671]
MRYSTLHVLGLIPLLMLVSIGARADLNILWQKQADYIALRDVSGQSAFSHPQTVPVDSLARLLSQVQVENSQYNPSESLLADEVVRRQRVFTDREIDLLAHKVNQALQQAKTDEAVVFTISDFRPSYIGRQRLSVSGTAYVRDNRFYLLLGEMHVDVQLKQLRSGVTGTYGKNATKAEILRNGLNTGNLQQATAHEWTLPLFDGAEAVNGRSDWLSVDMSQSYEYAVSTQQVERLDKKYLTEEQQEASNDVLEERIRKLEQAQQPVAAAPAASGDLESRLKKLQALYDNGTLPESVYLEKVRAIMREL